MKILILGTATLSEAIGMLLKNIPQVVSVELVTLSGNFEKSCPTRQETFVLTRESKPFTFFTASKYQASYGKSRRRNVLRGSPSPSSKRSSLGKVGRRNGGR